MPKTNAITKMFMTVASPGLSFSGNHANMTMRLIIQEAQPTLNCPCVATPWDNTVQGAEPKSDNNSNPSPNPMLVKAHSKTLRDFNSIDQSDLAAQEVCGNTCGFFMA